MPNLKFSRALKKQCAVLIRQNAGLSLKAIFRSSNTNCPVQYHSIRRIYGSIFDFLRDVDVKICELRHFGNQYKIDPKRKLFSHKHGLLKIIKITSSKNSLYKLSNGWTYRKGLLLQYFNLCDSYPKKKIDIQELYKLDSLIKSAGSRAKARRIPFYLNTLDLYKLYNFKIPKRCSIFKYVVLNYYNTNNLILDYSPSLDRIVPELGYVKGNVRIISHRANACLGNLSLKEAKAVLKDKIGKDKKIIIRDI